MDGWTDGRIGRWTDRTTRIPTFWPLVAITTLLLVQDDGNPCVLFFVHRFPVFVCGPLSSMALGSQRHINFDFIPIDCIRSRVLAGFLASMILS